ncbi:hypothetical protein [Vibrio sp. Vb2201]|uniref:hypothetical protein n=1 Tax=Vibrio sp. Vb2201 TaxID=3074655 RepID=UPI00280EDF3C|nr:hypothetical protein [Vibrio sp. Vb2201]ELB2761125.1 hypothetical protein [Vibrio alginolyticus]MDW1802725.1 hypothetical protein [Vibrio sp. Vb2201]
MKNWTVVVKQIKKQKTGFINHTNYLLNPNTDSHKNTIIKPIGDVERAIHNTLQEVESRKALRKKQGKRGGAIQNYSTSFVLTLPTEIKASGKDWAKMTTLVIKKLVKDLKLDYDLVTQCAVAVLHDEQGHKPSHVHLLIPNIIDGTFHKEITQHKAVYSVKNGFNKAVFKILGLDHKKHKPKQEEELSSSLDEAYEKAIEELRKEINGTTSDDFNQKRNSQRRRRLNPFD